MGQWTGRALRLGGHNAVVPEAGDSFEGEGEPLSRGLLDLVVNKVSVHSFHLFNCLMTAYFIATGSHYVTQVGLELTKQISDLQRS